MRRSKDSVKQLLGNLVILIVISPFATSTDDDDGGYTEIYDLKINEFEVPTTLHAGDSTLLRCFYELGTEPLYSVKWYKDMQEFYRYIPRAKQQFRSLEAQGIEVDLSKSNHTQVFLVNMQLDSSGNYTCQVSTGKPYYRCVQTTKPINIVVPPSEGPILMMDDEKTDYEFGDNVSIQCTSGKGKPAPQLKWYINDKLADTEPGEREVMVYPDNFESSSLVLRFHLKPDIFKDGKVVLKCVATVHQRQTMATKEITAGAWQSKSIGLLILLTSLMALSYQDTSAV